MVPDSTDEGFEDEPNPDPVYIIEDFKEQLVLILAPEPIDEGFEEEAPPDPVSGEFKEQLFLVLVSEGSPGSASASEGSPGLCCRLPELCACSGRPPGRPPELCQLSVTAPPQRTRPHSTQSPVIVGGSMGLQHKCCHRGHCAHSRKGGQLRGPTPSPDKTFPLASALPSLPPWFPPRTSRSASLRRKHVGVANTSSSHIAACTGLH
ncbi:hypothetical protein CRENBAI_001687 [Crenichthys baileyi]|uniref:Uncharacterized protein n=1 Tax=Crenichthys baileyi TaxID=28760 RepID=A0AAV9RH78_9TELE